MLRSGGTAGQNLGLTHFDACGFDGIDDGQHLPLPANQLDTGLPGRAGRLRLNCSNETRRVLDMAILAGRFCFQTDRRFAHKIPAGPAVSSRSASGRD